MAKECGLILLLTVLPACSVIPHAEKDPNIIRSWAVTGCVTGVEQQGTMGREQSVNLCRSMVRLLQADQCRTPTPVREHEQTL